MKMKPLAAWILLVSTIFAAPCRADDNAQAAIDLRDAKLGEIALLVKDLSDGKSRLLIGQAAGADPNGGVVRSLGWGSLPLISVCPVSASANTKIDKIGDCVLLGAVALLVTAEPPGARESGALGEIPMAPPGVYLLAYKGELSDKEEENGSVYLVSVSVDKDGNAAYKAHLETPAVRRTRPLGVEKAGIDWFGANVEFADKDHPSRATAGLAASEADGRYRTYSFQLDLQVIMT